MNSKIFAIKKKMHIINSNYIMLKSIRRLKKLILYKNIKIFEYAINDVKKCKNYKFYFYVNVRLARSL